MEFTYSFIDLFFWSVWLLAPILIIMCIIIVVLGQIAGRIENWQAFDSLYWTFITAFTVGYGDMRPLARLPRILSIFIALFGIMFTGVIVAVTVNTATIMIERHFDPEELEQIKTKLEE